MLNWANQFGTFCFLDNHRYSFQPHNAECILAAGVADSFDTAKGHKLGDLNDFIEKQKRWLFGHLGYDLKNEIDTTHSGNPDYIGFQSLFLFQPKVIVQFDENSMNIFSESEDAATIFQQINTIVNDYSTSSHPVSVAGRFSRDEYLETISALKAHIVRGDCYEINLCQEFFAEKANVDPLQLYKKLSIVSPNPFSAFYKLNGKYLACASPERFLKKTGVKIITQPIKGTSSRISDSYKDEESRSALLLSSKDRSENVMIVDLVRNDMSRICKEASVGVDELFGVYSFPQVHQMISTVSGELKDNITFTEIVKAMFPMGSMTGAPKRRVMELIERYEKTKRGIFSGSVGYIDPAGDFDFNVVIRSLMYNSTSNYLSFQVGAAITFYSDPKQEWEECLLKAKALQIVLNEA